VIVIIGYIAAVIDVGQFAPQLWRTIRRRNQYEAMRGLSIVTYLIATAQAILWVIYGLATDRLPIGLPNLFIAPACAYILALAVRARLRGARRTP
jgi:MtN3 and saliva related transmembrane protein